MLDGSLFLSVHKGDIVDDGCLFCHVLLRSFVFCLYLCVTLYGRLVGQVAETGRQVRQGLYIRVLSLGSLYARLTHACPLAMVMFARWL